MVEQYGFTRKSALCGGAQARAEMQLILMSPV
jgi:hypothetical protein